MKNTDPCNTNLSSRTDLENPYCTIFPFLAQCNLFRLFLYKVILLYKCSYLTTRVFYTDLQCITNKNSSTILIIMNVFCMKNENGAITKIKYIRNELCIQKFNFDFLFLLILFCLKTTIMMIITNISQDKI